MTIFSLLGKWRMRGVNGLVCLALCCASSSDPCMAAENTTNQVVKNSNIGIALWLHADELDYYPEGYMTAFALYERKIKALGGAIVIKQSQFRGLQGDTLWEKFDNDPNLVAILMRGPTTPGKSANNIIIRMNIRTELKNADGGFIDIAAPDSNVLAARVLHEILFLGAMNWKRLNALEYAKYICNTDAFVIERSQIKGQDRCPNEWLSETTRK